LSHDLIERIYEAAFVPEAWPALLQTMADNAGSVSGALIIHRRDTGPLWTSTPSIRDMGAEYCGSGAWQESKLTSYVVGRQPSGFVLDVEFFPPEMLASEVGTSPLLLGEGKLLTNVTAMPSGEFAILTLERRHGGAHLEEATRAWLNHLRPHLSRAAMISARLELERANTTVETLSRLGLAAAVMTSASTILAANSQFEALTALFQFRAFDKLSLRGAAGALFQEAVSSPEALGGSVRSIPVPARDEQPARIIHVSPIKRAAHDIFNRASCLVVVTAIGDTHAPSGAMLHGLFDLTPAEARLVQLLAQGQTINQAATRSGLSVATLRTQLRSVFAKTGAASGRTAPADRVGGLCLFDKLSPAGLTRRSRSCRRSSPLHR
jgi:DNA-binding CsgD family transcriptional regulator